MLFKSNLNYPICQALSLSRFPMYSRWCYWWSTVVISLLAISIKPAKSQQPQTNRLQLGCSQYNVTNLPNFLANRNRTFLDLRTQLSNGSTHFATAQNARSSDPVYGMVQCRNYLSTVDCLACFDVAAAMIRTCSAANGARVIYDDCFIRYETNAFYNQTTLPGNAGQCGNRTASQPTAFDTAAQGLLTDLRTATPRINGFFAASTREVVVGDNETVYAVAQCVETVSQTGCEDCLTVAYGNIQTCPPNGDGRAFDVGCFLRYSDTPFFSNNETTNITPFLGAGAGGGGGGSSDKGAIIGGIVGGVGFLILVLALGLLLWYRQSRKSKTERGNLLGATELQGPMIYSYNNLKTATKNFSEEHKLGEGGFGDVYKGIVKDGTIVAVKKLAVMSSRSRADFESEVRVISNVHHRNLIRLLGCCSKGSDLLLVLEYMANGSLDKFLYGEKRGTLNWKQRLDIMFGTARGLAYLHEQYHVTIIHRDIKSSNILLDNDYQPKIADFGLARLVPEDKTHISTRFAGTLGYTAPEYAIHGQLTEKVDTYSFGIVVLEIISGRKCNDVQDDSVVTDTYLLQHAWNLYENDMHLKLMDETLDTNEYTEADAKKIIEIALMCTQSPASVRPTMSEVVMLLSDRSLEQRELPRRPSLGNSDMRFRVDTSMSTASSVTNASVTMTEFTGR